MFKSLKNARRTKNTMAKISSIKLSSRSLSVSSGGAGDYFYKDEKAPPGKKAKTVKLRVGEVVRGEVLDVPNSKEAVIRLPSGAVRCYLKGELRTGDILYFKALETSPSLVLKIYAAPVKIGDKEIPTDEIVRALNLDKGELYWEIVAFLRRRKSIISVNDAAYLHSAYKNIPKVVLEKKDSYETLWILFSMQIAQIPTSPAVYERVLPLFGGSQYVYAALKLLESKIRSLPAAPAIKMARVFLKLYDKDTTDGEKLRFFAIRESKKNEEPTLFEALKEILRQKSEDEQSDFAVARKYALSLMKIIQAQQIWNSFAASASSALQAFAPIADENSFRIVQLLLQKKNKADAAKIPFEFTTSAETDRIGDIFAQGALTGSAVSAGVFSNSKDVVSYIANRVDGLRKTLSEKNFEVKSVNVGPISETNLDFIQQQFQTLDGNFSIVV